MTITHKLNHLKGKCIYPNPGVYAVYILQTISYTSENSFVEHNNSGIFFIYNHHLSCSNVPLGLAEMNYRMKNICCCHIPTIKYQYILARFCFHFTPHISIGMVITQSAWGK